MLGLEYIEGFVQNYSISSELAMQSSTKPSISFRISDNIPRF